MGLVILLKDTEPGIAQEVLKGVHALFQLLVERTGIRMTAVPTSIRTEDILLLPFKEDCYIHEGDLAWGFGKGKTPTGATAGGD